MPAPMPATTPAQLSLELGVSQKTIRDFLRDQYGTLPEGVTRWELDESQAGSVRRAFGRASSDRRQWTLEPGDVVRRRAIHGAYRGQQQGGISTPRGIPDILIFTDPAAGARYGYDRFEGLREDGSYAYTGEGQFGDQEFVRGNRALRDSLVDGKTIRLLRTEGVFATYVGAFTLDSPPFDIETIPDVEGNPRQGIIFNLVPLEASVELLPAYGGELEESEDSLVDYGAHPRTWSPPDYSNFLVGQREFVDGTNRMVSRVEFKLQSDFGEWLTKQGSLPRRLPLRVGNVRIEPDFYVEDRGWIVEAKKTSARGHVRTAIGQVLDYVHIARKAGLEVTPVILLPGKPEADLVELITGLDITLIVRADDGFESIRRVD